LTTSGKHQHSLSGIAALICLISTYASVAAFAVVQLYFLASPRIPLLNRLARNRVPDRDDTPG
jgi:hypothetical protein